MNREHTPTLIRLFLNPIVSLLLLIWVLWGKSLQVMS